MPSPQLLLHKQEVNVYKLVSQPLSQPLRSWEERMEGMILQPLHKALHMVTDAMKFCIIHRLG